MPWMTQPDAAHALGVSTRTLARRIAAHTVETKRDGTHVLVWAEPPEPGSNPVQTVAELGTSLSRTAEALQTMREADLRLMAATMATLDKVADRADKAAERAHEAEQQAREAESRADTRATRAVRWGVGFAACFGLVAVSATMAVGWRYHAETVEHVAETAELRQRVKTAEAETARVLDAHLAGFGLQVADAGR